MELSSLSLATAINSKGTYMIQVPQAGQEVRTGDFGGWGGRIIPESDLRVTSLQISPDTVVRLSVPESHGELEEDRECSLEELRELLHKLMLLSGLKEHGAAEVELFSEVSAGRGQVSLLMRAQHV